MRETVVERVCSNEGLGDACVCENKVHQKVALVVTNMETNTFDPLHLHSSRGKTLAVLLVACIAAGLISDQAFELACGIQLWD